jgi:RNA polymerase sigma factor (sigma-70 family)
MEKFEQLSAQYEPMLYKIIHSLHIYKNWEEFHQIGLIGLWEASQRYDPTKGTFTNYAYTFIKGKILTEMTKSKLHEERNVYPKDEFWELVEDPHSDLPLAENLLLSYCNNLTKNQSKWLLYTVINNLTVKEIAKKERVSISAVKAWRVGAREKLRKKIVHTR